MALSAQQQAQAAAYWVNVSFVTTNLTANVSTADIVAAVAAIDNAFDTTLTNATAAVGGNTTIINGLNQIIPAPFSTMSVAQKTMLVCHVLMKRAGLI